ncbi:MAG: lycopene cyclase, partial [Proteobacteria bacterium]
MAGLCDNKRLANMNKETSHSADIILIGSGLSNCLIAHYLRLKNPSLQILVFEKAEEMPPARTWSFHGSDLGHEASVILPLASRSWAGYQVRFPKFQRKLTGTYASIRPQDLQHHIKNLLGESLHFGAAVKSASATEVQLANGQTYSAPCVIDGRGPSAPQSEVGYQKFLGLHVLLEQPHHLETPVLMDNAIPQTDGFRFMYCLPWGPRELLIEDTYYSGDPSLDLEKLKAQILTYAQKQGWEVEQILSQESMAIPIPFSMQEY